MIEDGDDMIRKDAFRSDLQDHIRLFQAMESQCLDAVERIGDGLIEALDGGHKILIAGNGGSAADAQHFAAELIGRYQADRAPVPAIALTTDTSILSAVANDFGFDHVFRRQVLGLGRSGDVFIGISTSGNSPNVIKAMETASEMRLRVFALLGKGGGKMADLADDCVIVPSRHTPRIQEAHQWIYHTWCGMIDARHTNR